VLDEFDQWWVEDLSFSADGRWLATIDQSGTIRLWSVATGETSLTLMAGAMNKSVRWSPDGRHLVSGGPGTLQIWAVAAG
jgi:WD40 repeat protein